MRWGGAPRWARLAMPSDTPPNASRPASQSTASETKAADTAALDINVASRATEQRARHPIQAPTTTGTAALAATQSGKGPGGGRAPRTGTSGIRPDSAPDQVT